MTQISCLCVTKAGRLGQFSRSLDCFQRQTHPDRELVVITDDFEHHRQVQNLTKGNPLVRHFIITHPTNLGALRNLSMDVAHGDVICQWDDDDYCIPERLAVQLDYLQKSKKLHACFLSEQLHYFERTGEVYWKDWNYNFGLIPGTLMGLKSVLRRLRYPTEGEVAVRGEDIKFLELLPPWRIGALQGMGHMHVYSFHGANTWDEEMHRAIKGAKTRGFLVKRRELIVKSLVAAGLVGPFRVTGSDGLAFTSSCDVD